MQQKRQKQELWRHQEIDKPSDIMQFTNYFSLFTTPEASMSVGVVSHDHITLPYTTSVWMKYDLSDMH
jgi:hypothetical protein